MSDPTSSSKNTEIVLYATLVVYGINFVISGSSLIYLYVGSRYDKTFLQPMFLKIIFLLFFGAVGFVTYNFSVLKIEQGANNEDKKKYLFVGAFGRFMINLQFVAIWLITSIYYNVASKLELRRKGGFLHEVNEDLERIEKKN